MSWREINSQRATKPFFLSNRFFPYLFRFAAVGLYVLFWGGLVINCGTSTEERVRKSDDPCRRTRGKKDINGIYSRLLDDITKIDWVTCMKYMNSNWLKMLKRVECVYFQELIDALSTRTNDKNNWLLTRNLHWIGISEHQNNYQYQFPIIQIEMKNAWNIMCEIEAHVKKSER